MFGQARRYEEQGRVGSFMFYVRSVVYRVVLSLSYFVRVFFALYVYGRYVFIGREGKRVRLRVSISRRGLFSGLSRAGSGV